jgi:hypothetical protein
MSVPPIDPIQPPPGPDSNSGYYPPTGVAQRASINVLALIGFITAITGTGCGIISLILSIIGLNQINKEPNRYNGKGLAIAGIVISAGCIIYFFMFINSVRYSGYW